MEKMPEPIENPNHAWEAAHAEKPLRDIALENWVSEEEKEALGAIAVKRGEVVLQNILQKEAAKPKSENKIEGRDILNRTLELIKHDSNINFIAYGTGDITGEGRGGVGAGGYIFDQKKAKMVYAGADEHVDFLDDRPDPENSVPFQGKVSYYPSDTWSYVVVQFPFGYIKQSELNNNYMTDNRGNSFITVGVRFKKSLDGEIIKELIKGEEFIGQVAQRAAKEFIPGYWNFVIRQHDLHKESEKK